MSAIALAVPRPHARSAACRALETSGLIQFETTGERLLTLTFDGEPAAALRAAVLGGRLIVVAGDPLTRVILGAEQLEAPFDLEARWSTAAGFTMAGGVGIVLVIPVERVLGFITLHAIELSIGICSAGSLTLGAAADLEGALGPFALTAGGLGLELALTDAPDNDGTLGPFDAGASDEMTVEVDTSDGRLEIAVGPVREGSGKDAGLARVLSRLVDDVATQHRDGAEYDPGHDRQA